MARVVLARRAGRELLELDWPLIDAIENALRTTLARDPHAGHALRGLRSLRVGAYRIIYQLADDDETIRAATIRHRSILYRSDPR